jgi:hypothetical protein
MPKYNTWKDFYWDKHLEGGTFREFFDSKVKAFNHTSLDHLNGSKTLQVTYWRITSFYNMDKVTGGGLSCFHMPELHVDMLCLRMLRLCLYITYYSSHTFIFLQTVYLITSFTTSVS